jgi:hypothetical protein
MREDLRHLFNEDDLKNRKPKIPILTKESIGAAIKESFQKMEKEDEIIMFQGCRTLGIVARTTLDLRICADPECESCRMVENAVKQGLKP